MACIRCMRTQTAYASALSCGATGFCSAAVLGMQRVCQRSHLPLFSNVQMKSCMNGCTCIQAPVCKTHLRTRGKRYCQGWAGSCPACRVWGQSCLPVRRSSQRALHRTRYWCLCSLHSYLQNKYRQRSSARPQQELTWRNKSGHGSCCRAPSCAGTPHAELHRTFEPKSAYDSEPMATLVVIEELKDLC
jgi:hypothetical protein